MREKLSGRSRVKTGAVYTRSIEKVLRVPYIHGFRLKLGIWRSIIKCYVRFFVPFGLQSRYRHLPTPRRQGIQT